LPVGTAWNGKLMQQGCGGSCGDIPGPNSMLSFGSVAYLGDKK
jgi:hypothetical protein